MVAASRTNRLPWKELLAAVVLGISFSSTDAFLQSPGCLQRRSSHQNQPLLQPRLKSPQLATYPQRWNPLGSFVMSRAGDSVPPPSPAKKGRVPQIQTTFPQAERVVGIGDIHGDGTALKKCLRMAKLMDEDETWIGGKAHLVQIGDILDRGEDERECLQLLMKLRREAEAAGGHVHLLLGNHEIMNVDLDFRYVTTRHMWEGWEKRSNEPMDEEEEEAGRELALILKDMGWPKLTMDRVEAFRPGGHITTEALAYMSVAVQIGQTVFVHGGLKLEHVRYGLEKLNQETREWLVEGSTNVALQHKPEILDDVDSPLWNRQYSVPNPSEKSLAELEKVLALRRARRMVVGHTPQLKGINSVFSKHGYEVWRCDTGMSKGMMGGPVEAFEILEDGTVHVLTEKGIVPALDRSPQRVGDFVDVCDIDSGLCTPMPEEVAKLMLDDGHDDISSALSASEEATKDAVAELVAATAAAASAAAAGVPSAGAAEIVAVGGDAAHGGFDSHEFLQSASPEEEEKSEFAKQLKEVVAESSTSAQDDGQFLGMHVDKEKRGEEVKHHEVEEGRKQGRKEVVDSLFRRAKEIHDDELKVKVLVQHILADAKQRDDASMSKKTVRDILSSVLGFEVVKEYKELISSEVDRIAPPVRTLELNVSIMERESQVHLRKGKRESSSAASGYSSSKQRTSLLHEDVVAAKQSGTIVVANGVSKEGIEAMRARERRASIATLLEQDDENLPTRQRMMTAVGKLISDARARHDVSLTKRDVREMLKEVVGKEIVEDNLLLLYAEVDRLVPPLHPQERAVHYLSSLNKASIGAGEAVPSKEYVLSLSPSRR